MKNILTAVAVGILLFGAILFGNHKDAVFAAHPLNSLPSQAEANSLQPQIVAAERAGLDALKTGNVELFANLTADEAVFVDAAGPATKAQVVKNVNGFTLTEYSMEDVKFVPLSATSGLISYKTTEKGVSHGHEFTATVYVSSIWANRGGKWLCLFSQETLARIPPKQPN